MIVEFPECAADNGPFSGPKHLYAIEIGTDADANDSYAMRTASLYPSNSSPLNAAVPLRIVVIAEM